MKYECDKCGEEVNRFKDLHKVKKEHLCKKCYQENRKQNRQKLIEEEEGLKEDLRRLEIKRQKEYLEKKREYNREYYQSRKEKIDLPIIKNSKPEKYKEREEKKSYSYLTKEERQDYLRILMSKGLDFEQARQRVQDLVDSQIKIRKIMQKKRKSEKEIKAKQQEMLERLFRKC